MAVQPGRGTGEHRSPAEDRAGLIVGGAHTYSKDDAHFPPNAPRTIVGGYGCSVLADDGRRFLDWGMGLRTTILGHAYRVVAEAAKAALDGGANHTRPTVYEGALAERLCHYIPCAERVKFGKNGSDATTAAVRLARAFTGRSRILVCDGSFHASDDWWLSTQPLSRGTVRQGTAVFPFNDATVLYHELQTREYAAVIMEAMAFEWPLPGYLAQVKRMCEDAGTVLVFDEMITGLRFGMSGAQGMFGVTPHLATFGKAIANGFSVSALVGRRDIMETKGVHLLSSTHGGETVGLAAAIATIDECEAKKVPDYLYRIGERLRLGLLEAGYDVRGYAASPNVVWPSDVRWFKRDYSQGASTEIPPIPDPIVGPERMAFMAAMCERGILAPYWAPSFSHTEEDVDRTVEAAREVSGGPRSL